MKKLAIITTHPIQYNAPLFKLLAERKQVAIKVFYTWGDAVLEKKYDPGFGKNVTWDIPLLDGYDYHFEKNTAKNPGSSHFNGIINPGLINAIEAWKADAVLVFGWAFKSHLQLLRYFKGRVPVFFRGDSTLLDDNSSGIKKNIRRLFLSWVYRHVDAAFYTGTHNKAYFLACGLRDNQLLLAPHAIDNNKFEEADKISSRKSGRETYNIPEDAFLFLFAGKLENKKDPNLLGEAFEKMQQPHCHLLFAGSGKLETALKERFKSNKAIHFAGFQNQSQMPLLYNSCDVFVLPSRGPGETWGLAINEAMASGKAIIASDKCGGAIDLVHDGINGYSFPAGSIEGLQEAMDKCYHENIGIEEMGKRSLQIIKEYNFSAVAEAIETAVNATWHF